MPPVDPCPVFVADPLALDWVDLVFGVPVERSISLRNDCAGTAGVSIGVAIDDVIFTPSATAFELPPGTSAELAIGVTLVDYLGATGTLTLTTDDPATPTLTIPLTATASLDQDADGVVYPDDCDDTDATIHPGADEIWYDGIDQDCSGGSDDDQDGDGVDALAKGGADCDDEDATIAPGMIEVWYDGIDQDCSGGSDYDQDADGVEVYPTGEDCADTDPATTAGTAEVRNGLDDDCNGAADDGLVEVGDVLITEILINPSAADDAAAEWFELHNPLADPIDLVGWTVVADDGDTFTIPGTLVLDPGAYVVLGVDADTARNGGVTPALVYDGATFSFADDTDSVALVSADGLTVAVVAYDRGWDVAAGASLSLDPFYEATPTDPNAWCASVSPFGAGDLGTPGAVNDRCSDLDHDGDAEAPDAGDCDDDDPGISTTAVETADGIDQDCNVYVDDVPFDTTGVPYVAGAARSTNYMFPLAIADGDGDGTDEMYVYAYDGPEEVWSLPTTSWASWGGTFSSYGTQVLSGPSSQFGYLCCTFTDDITDLDGDGTPDLGVSGASRSAPAFHVYLGASLPRSSTTAPDLVITESGIGTTPAEVRVADDLDADGVNDVVYPAPEATEGGHTYAGHVAVYTLAGLPGGASLVGADAEVSYTSSRTNDFLGNDVALGDWTGDGYVDVAIASATSVWLVAGDGLTTTGSAAVTTVATGELDFSTCTLRPQVRTVDDDGDGLVSLFTACDSLARWGDVGAFTGVVAAADAPSTLDVPTRLPNTTMAGHGADVDRDGLDDLQVATYASSGAETWLYAIGVGDWPVGQGAFTDAISVRTWPEIYAGWGPSADLDHDGDDELTLYNWSADGNAGIAYVWSP